MKDLNVLSIFYHFRIFQQPIINLNQKLQYIKITVLFVLFAHLSSCNTSNINNAQDIVINEIRDVDSVLSFKCRLLEFPTFKNRDVLDEIYGSLERTWNFSNYSRKGLKKAIENHKLELSKDEDRLLVFELYNDTTDYGFFDDHTMSIFSLDEKLLTIKYSFYGHIGGVGHPSQKFSTICLDTEKVMKISDIIDFTKKDFNWDRLLRLFAVGQCLLDDEPFNYSENFYINSESITFVYEKYEIACGADGISSITIPLYFMNYFELLREDFTLMYLNY